MTILCVGEEFAVGEGDLEFGVLRVEIVLEAIEVAGALPFAHGEVVEQIVATGLGAGGWHFILSENPLQALDGELAHVLDGVCAQHDDVHASETAHGAYVNHIVLDPRVAEPSGHEVFDTMNGCGGYGWLLVGLRDTQIVRGKSFILTRNVNTGFQVSVVDGETLNNFHDNIGVRGER